LSVSMRFEEFYKNQTIERLLDQALYQDYQE